MDASIIIPTFNRLHFLQKTLQSLTRLTYLTDAYEVIVVDDGSKDGTSDFLEGASFPFHFRFFKHAENRFASAARNTGIKCAQGEVIIFIDDDMEVVPDFLEEHMKCQKKHRNIAVVGNIQVHPDVHSTGMIQYLSTRGVHKLKPGQPVPFKYWCSGNASVKKSILLEVGLFDEQIQHYGGEDLELSYRLQKRGNICFQYTSKAISYHMHFREFNEVCQLMYDYGRTSLAYMIRKHPELAKTVRYHLMEPIRSGDDPFLLIHQKLYMKVVMNPVIYTCLKRFAKHSRSGFPAFCFDYVIAYNYLKGLQQALINKQVSDSINR